MKEVEIKRMSKAECIIRELNSAKDMSVKYAIEIMKELDDILDDGYLLIKDKREMFYSDSFIKRLLIREFNKNWEDIDKEIKHIKEKRKK